MSEQKPRIIIIDDDDEKRGIYAEKFELEGFAVEQATNGKNGLEKILQQPPDIIFTGIQMPELDGFTMIECIKQNPALVQIPVMINSHLGRDEDRKRSKALGVQEFIYYGFVPLNEIVERAKKLIGRT